jgi:hypothetical protein
MIAATLMCVTLAWTAATGDVCSYRTFLDDVPYEEVEILQSAVCLQDTLPHTFRVQAVGCNGEIGPMSDTSDEFTMKIMPPDYLAPMCDRADLDRDGVAGYSDFGLFTQCFGQGHE